MPGGSWCVNEGKLRILPNRWDWYRFLPLPSVPDASRSRGLDSVVALLSNFVGTVLTTFEGNAAWFSDSPESKAQSIAVIESRHAI